MNLILSRMVEQFVQKHGKQPVRIVIDPVALVVLTNRRSVAPKWKGIPVECRDLEVKQPGGLPNALGVITLEGDLRAMDLAV